MRDELGVEPLQIDVGGLVRRTVATLYSHLVTRPTGRAVRLAIETQLAEAGETSCSLIDLTEVTVLDFSCADEVVAKLLQRYLEDDRPQDAFFVFQGAGDRHRDPIEAVLERASLAAVAGGAGSYQLVGIQSSWEARVWSAIEERGHLAPASLPVLFRESVEREALEALVRRRLIFRAQSGAVHALSRLVADLPRGAAPSGDRRSPGGPGAA
jgi:hypothetical protein